MRLVDRRGRAGGIDLPDMRHGFAGDRSARDQRASGMADGVDPEFKQKRCDLGLERELFGRGGGSDRIDWHEGFPNITARLDGNLSSPAAPRQVMFDEVMFDQVVFDQDLLRLENDIAISSSTRFAGGAIRAAPRPHQRWNPSRIILGPTDSGPALAERCKSRTVKFVAGLAWEFSRGLDGTGFNRRAFACCCTKQPQLDCNPWTSARIFPTTIQIFV